MRTWLIVFLLVSPAIAAPPQGSGARPVAALTPISLDSVPQGCREIAEIAGSSSINRALSARISLANCLADHKIKSVVLCDCEQSVRDVEARMALSIQLLDEVFVAGDPATKVLARHAKGELLAGLATRLNATIPPPISQSEEAIALRENRVQMLQPLIEPWRIQARGAFAEADRIAREHPELAKNAAVLAAVRASRAQLSTGVAKR